MSEADASGVLIGVELGGTKMVVAASGNGLSLDAREQLPTGDPDTTFSAIRRTIVSVADRRPISAIGIASFGPIDLRAHSTEFGRIISTPKPGWSGVDVVEGITGEFKVPFAIDTDVNAAVRAEKLHGAGTELDHVAYITVGTGVGGGIWSDGRVLRGANHSEIGHIRVPRQSDDHHRSSCPFHADCLEGMASGVAVRERWGMSAENLDHLSGAATRLEAWYLARCIAGLCAIVPVEMVIVGGGLAKLPNLHEEVATALAEASGLYPPIPFAEGGPAVVAPALGDDAGVMGAIELANLATQGSAATQG